MLYAMQPNSNVKQSLTSGTIGLLSIMMLLNHLLLLLPMTASNFICGISGRGYNAATALCDQAAAMCSAGAMVLVSDGVHQLLAGGHVMRLVGGGYQLLQRVKLPYDTYESVTDASQNELQVTCK